MFLRLLVFLVLLPKVDKDVMLEGGASEEGDHAWTNFDVLSAAGESSLALCLPLTGGGEATGCSLLVIFSDSPSPLLRDGSCWGR